MTRCQLLNRPLLALLPVLLSIPAFAASESPDPGCETYQTWQIQGSVKSDVVGNRNNAYPEANATYWGSIFQLPDSTDMVIRGRFPRARYMAFQLYDNDRNVIDAINDQSILPDAGQNNPFVTGTETGTYTIRIVFGRKPRQPAPNTIYTESIAKVVLLYRIYYPTDALSLQGGTTNPILPEIYQNGALLSACPVRPIVVPEDNLVWGRLDNADFTGTRPFVMATATYPPTWVLSVTDSSTPYYPSADNSYMSALVNRDYLAPVFGNDVVIIRFKAPTFANTQVGEPPYLAVSSRQVRFWSVCMNEFMTTGVVRCVADYQTPLRDGFATVVISDPSKKPSDQVLATHSAVWLPWGALLPGDKVYDIDDKLLDNSSGVFYQGFVIYRQTLANSSWTQSFEAVGKKPRALWQNSMGDYWPVIGYCSGADFANDGAGCLKVRRQ